MNFMRFLVIVLYGTAMMVGLDTGIRVIGLKFWLVLTIGLSS